MTNLFCWLDLQLFAGDGDGGADGSAPGSEMAASGQKLLELGVPADKIRNRAKRESWKHSPGTANSRPGQFQASQKQDAAAAHHPTEETKEAALPARMSWEEIMADPAYNKQMQAVVQSRLKDAKSAQEAMGKITPALELLARKYGQDPGKIDYDALAKAIGGDSQFYQDKAQEMGVSVEAAMKLDQQEREAARLRQEGERALEEARIRSHIMKLEQQGEALKKTFPTFDLRAELRNPAFFRMTAPGVGLSVEDAYYAIHRNEIQAASMQVAAQKTAEKISNAIRAGQHRPLENGTSGQAPSVTTFDYRSASPAQRGALKQRIRQAAARGEKVYPGY